MSWSKTLFRAWRNVSSRCLFEKHVFFPTEHKQAECTCTLNQLFNLVSKSHIVCSEPYVCKMYEVQRGRKRHNGKKEDALCQSCREREKQTEKAWVSRSSSQVKKQNKTKKQTPIKALPHSKLEAGPASQKNGISTACVGHSTYNRKQRASSPGAFTRL